MSLAKEKWKLADIILDSSLPAKDIYKKRGYIIIESHKIVTANEDVLCYDLMKKNSKRVEFIPCYIIKCVMIV